MVPNYPTVSAKQVLTLKSEWPLTFLPYMGMAAILVMWPGPFKQLFVPPIHGGYIWNLGTIGPIVSKEKSFETSSWADNIIFCHSRASNSEVKYQIWPKFNCFEISCLSWIPASLKKLRSKLKALWTVQIVPIKSLRGKIFVAQGLVTLQKIIRPGPNSNWSENLCLSWIPASLKKFRSKLKSL